MQASMSFSGARLESHRGAARILAFSAVAFACPTGWSLQPWMPSSSATLHSGPAGVMPKASFRQGKGGGGGGGTGGGTIYFINGGGPTNYMWSMDADGSN